MRHFFRKYLNSIVPLYCIIPLITCFVFNTLVYYGTMVIDAKRYHYDFTTSFDKSVPVIPQFVIIYFVCYLFWAINYIMIGKINKEHCMKFVLADITSRLICAIIFILLPSTNVRPEVIGSGFSELLLKHLYIVDRPFNLFPSIHCLVSWFCYIGIRGQKQIPRWYRAFSCIFALAVCLSTQFTKQHYIIDLLGGILLAEAAYYFANHTRLYIGVGKFFDKITKFLFGDEVLSVIESEEVCVKKQEEHI